ncbi:hypothetical protein [Paraglaciecola marina]|uniref:hypothetical protein n=1 Tax=Paraglaciecola marina TaxID=2500157 RepID=UPI00105E8FB3|nr:hypothetical protein [Paraglaciecola marina]
MFTKSKIAVVALISSFAVISTVNAEEMSLESYVSGMVNQAMVVAQQEIKNTVQENILNVAYNVSLDESQSYNTKVTIKDIKVKSDEASVNKAK